MALNDMIAQFGYKAARAPMEGYLAGIQQKQQEAAAAQQATLRDLQIQREQREAAEYETELGRRRAREDVELRAAEVGVKSQEQVMEQREQQMKRAAELMEQDREKFQNYKTDEERKNHLFDLTETERLLTGATNIKDPEQRREYFINNADIIKKHGGNDIDALVDRIPDATTEELEGISESIINFMPKHQAHIKALEKLDHEYGLKKEVAAAKTDKPGTAGVLTAEVSKQVRGAIETSDVFKNLEGGFDEEKGMYTKEQGKAMSAVTNTFDSIRKNTARIKRTELDQNLVMQALKDAVDTSATDDWGYNTFNSQNFNDKASNLATMLANPTNKKYTTSQIIDAWRGQFL